MCGEKSKLLPFVLVFATTFSTFRCGEEIREVPYKLPDLILLSTEGDEVNLRDFHGKVLVLDLWATWCEPCAKSVPVLEKLKEIAGEDFVFLGINTDQNKSPEEIETHARKLGMSYPSLMDTHHVFVNLFRLEGLPGLFVFSRSGFLLHKQYGIKNADLEGLSARISAWKKLD